MSDLRKRLERGKGNGRGKKEGGTEAEFFKSKISALISQFMYNACSVRFLFHLFFILVMVLLQLVFVLIEWM